jgi:GNAT superfamily N-acetyltransferase
MEIRPLEPERDADACVAMVRAASPHTITNREAWLHRVATLGGESYVAEEDGRVVGESYAFPTLFGDTSTAVCMVTVAEPSRRRGIGTALFGAIAVHFDETLIARFYENDAGVAFAQKLGFRHARSEAESVLDVAAFDGAVPEGVDLRPVSATDPRHAHLIDLEATRDMPTSEEIVDMPYEEWEDHVLRYPLFIPEGSFVAYVDEEPAAVSLLVADLETGRSGNMFVGTRAAFRGRGLARAAKIASILWAKEHGVTEMATGNDETNAPMLAINRSLGFRPAGRRVEWLREGTASSPAPPAPAT